MDTDSFVLSINTKDNINNSEYLEDLFYFSNLSENVEFFSNKNKELQENSK